MASVTREQFVISREFEVVHVPTGWLIPLTQVRLYIVAMPV